MNTTPGAVDFLVAVSLVLVTVAAVPDEAVVGAVEDRNRRDGMLGPEVHFPPRVGGVFLRVGFAAIAVFAARVAVDGSGSVAAVGRIDLRRLALARDVATVAENFDFSQRQCLLLTGQLDADVSAHHGLAVRRR